MQNKAGFKNRAVSKNEDLTFFDTLFSPPRSINFLQVVFLFLNIIFDFCRFFLSEGLVWKFFFDWIFLIGLLRN